ncbi:MAG: hypothetical protein QOI08_1180 [Actinomycetota bacterium]|nr:hypothetical protein [Actinomycetota bacterium]
MLVCGRNYERSRVVLRDEGTAGEMTQISGTSTRHPRPSLVFAVLVPAVIVAAVMVPVAALRPLDGDEGFYALAAKLVAHGKTPYVDFWFLQAPLLPYVYGTWERIIGESWYVLRSLSVVLTVALGCVIYWHVLRRWSARRLALIAVLLFATTPLGFQWFPTIKTYALSTLLLFTAYVWAQSRSAKAWFVAGLFAGLAVDVRLLFGSVVIVFLVYARRDAWRFLVGLAVGLVPSIWLFVIGPGRFVNDTLRAQTTRSHASIPSNVFGKTRTVGRVLVEPHFLLLVVLGVTLIVVCVRRRQRLPLSVAIAATLGITNLLPTPSYAQYFVTLIPFLAVATIELVQLLDISARVREQRFLAIAALILVVPAAWSFHVVTSADSTELRISDARAVARAVDRVAHRDEVVLSFWPGFIYESHVRQFPGLESDFAPFVLSNTHLSPARAAEYHMLSTAGMKQAINSHAVRVIVFGKGAANQGVRWRQIMAAAGYRPVARVRSDVIIFRLAG